MAATNHASIVAPKATREPGKSQLDEADLRRLLGVALEQVEAPPECAVAVEGSIAEGFGNDKSDIDFVLIDDGEREFPTMPTILFLEDQRVEVRIRSGREMRRQAAEVFRLAAEGRRGVAKIDEEVLDRCQRFSRSLTLRNRALMDEVRLSLPPVELAAVITAWFAEHARESARCAIALGALGQDLEAVGWARAALTLAAKSWLAAHGETYIAKKWISEQLARVAGFEDLRVRILHLESPARSGLDPKSFVTEVVTFLADLGVDGCPADPKRLSLRRRADVTTWQIGSRVHVVRGRKDVFALSTEAARIWRSLEFKTPLPDALAANVEGAGATIGELHRLGLVGLAWRGDGEIRGRGESTMPPSTDRPVLSIGGAVFADDVGATVRLLPISASRFAAAGMQFAYVNQIIENAREDAVGAMGAGQWRVFERAVQRMVRHVCVAILNAYGVHPMPPHEEVHARVVGLDGLSPELKSLVVAIDRDLKVDDAAAASAGLTAIDDLVSQMRAATQSSLFPSCFDSAEAWQKTLDIGYDWVRLGAYLDATFPLNQVRDLLASGGQQPHGGGTNTNGGTR